MAAAPAKPVLKIGTNTGNISQNGSIMYVAVPSTADYAKFKNGTEVSVTGPDGQKIEGKVEGRPLTGPLFDLLSSGMNSPTGTPTPDRRLYGPDAIDDLERAYPGDAAVIDMRTLGMLVPVRMPMPQMLQPGTVA